MMGTIVPVTYITFAMCQVLVQALTETFGVEAVRLPSSWMGNLKPKYSDMPEPRFKPFSLLFYTPRVVKGYF